MGLLTVPEVPDLTSYVVLISTIISILFIAQIVYNLYFHPLRHIPGPFWARASGIPSWLQARTGKRHLWLYQQFQVFNTNILRVEPNLVLFRDPEAYSAIYGERSNVQRSNFYQLWCRNSQDVNTVNAIDPAEHARKRKILNRCFTDKSLRSALPFITSHIDRWHQLLVPSTNQSEWSDPIEISESLDGLILDILTDLCFGKSVQIKEPNDTCPNPSLKKIPHCIAQYLKFYYPICRSPLSTSLLYLKPLGLDTLFYHLAPSTIKQYDSFVTTTVTSRLSQTPSSSENPPRLDMLHFLTTPQPNTSSPPLTLPELLAESHLLIVAGSDTTSILLSAIFFHLTSPSQSQTLRNLTHEIRTTFPTLPEISHPSPTQTPFLTKCINEALRLITPGPCELPRTVLPGGITIQNQYFPQGTTVGVSHFVTANDIEIWGEDASRYNPDRWDTMTKEQKGAFHPFLSGPGNCAGRNLALSEMYTVVARTLWLFDVRRMPGSKKGGGGVGLYGLGVEEEEHFGLFDAYIALREGPEVQFRRRVD